MKKSLLLIFATAALASCSEYQQALKNENVGEKYQIAQKYYHAGKYKKALGLMEQIVPVYRGKPQAEQLMFMYANTFYNLEDFYLSGYQFERFEQSYPSSDSVEIAAYRSARSYYELSPRYSLDQKDTHKGLEKLQNFIDNYSESEYRQEVNGLVTELRNKLEKKDYEVANQYLKISDYKAAIEAFDNFILDHPGSPYRKDAFYGRLKASYELAINSLPHLVKERLETSKSHYNSFLKYFSESDLKEDADEISQDIEKRLGSYNTNS